MGIVDKIKSVVSPKSNSRNVPSGLTQGSSGFDTQGNPVYAKTKNTAETARAIDKPTTSYVSGKGNVQTTNLSSNNQTNYKVKTVRGSSNSGGRSQSSVADSTGYDPATNSNIRTEKAQVISPGNTNQPSINQTATAKQLTTDSNLNNPNTNQGKNKLDTISFKRDVLGKSGMYYALPYAGQEIGKLASRIPLIGEASNIPAPQWSQNLAFSLGSALIFGSSTPSTLGFKSNLLSSKSIVPTQETIFVSKITPLAKDFSKVETNSITRIGGAIDVKGSNLDLIKSVGDRYAGVGYSKSSLEIKPGVFNNVANKELVAGKNVANRGDLTLSYGTSYTKNTLNQIKYFKSGKTTDLPLLENTKTRVIGVSKPINEKITIFKGVSNNGAEIKGFILKDSKAQNDIGYTVFKKTKGFGGVSDYPSMGTTQANEIVQSQISSHVSSVDSVLPKSDMEFFKPVKNSFSISSTNIRQEAVPEVKQNYAIPNTNTLQIQESNTKNVEKIFTPTASIPKIKSAPTTRPRSVSSYIPRLDTPQITKTNTITKFDTPMARPIPIPISPTFPKRDNIPISMPHLPSFDEGSLGTRTFKGKTKLGYMPDFKSLAFGIKGKAPTRNKFTGYGEQARPIISSSNKPSFLKRMDNRIKLNMKTKAKNFIKNIGRRRR